MTKISGGKGLAEAFVNARNSKYESKTKKILGKQWKLINKLGSDFRPREEITIFDRLNIYE